MKFTADTFIPFVGILGNIYEKGKELGPYGLGKGLFYAAKAGIKKEGRREAIEKAGYYTFRSLIGFAAVALAYGLGDEDEEDMLKLYGEGPDGVQERMNRMKERPENTIVINGNRISLDLLGSVGIALKDEAKLLDRERYEKNVASFIGKYLFTLNDIWFESPIRTVKDLVSPKE